MARPEDGGFTLLELVVVIAVLALLASLVVPMFADTQQENENKGAQFTLSTLREALAGTPTQPGFWSDMRYAPGYIQTSLNAGQLIDETGLPLYDSLTRKGWRGPYITHEQQTQNTEGTRIGRFPQAGDRRGSNDKTFSERGFFPATVSYGIPGQRAIGDLWGNPVVIQIPPASAFSGPITDEQRLKFARLVSAGPDGELNTPLNPLAGKLVDNSTAARRDDIVLFLFRTDTYEVLP